MTHEDMSCLHQEVNKVGALETRGKLEDVLVIVVKVVRHIERLAHHLLGEAPDALHLFLLGCETGDLKKAECCSSRSIESLQTQELVVLIVHSIGEYHRPSSLNKISVKILSTGESFLISNIHLHPGMVLSQLFLMTWPLAWGVTGSCAFRRPGEAWVRGVVEDLHLRDVCGGEGCVGVDE